VERAGRRLVVLFVVASGSFMVIFDGAAIQMALPILQERLGATVQGVQWAMTAFLLMSTAVLLPAGRAGDVFGRDRVWRAGIGVFAVASLLCALSWRAIFSLAIPLGGALFWLSRKHLPASPRARAPLDAGSGFCSVVTLGALLLGGTYGHRWGWAARGTMLSFAISAVAMGAFIHRELRAPDPLIDVAILRQPIFLSGALSTFFGFAALSCGLTALPYLLLVAERWPVVQAGMMVGIVPLALSVAAPAAGRMTDRWGSRGICTTALVLLSLAYVIVAWSGQKASPPVLAFAMTLAGMGLGGFEAPNNVAVLSSVPPDRLGISTAMINAVRGLGMTLGVAVTATLLDRAMLQVHGTTSEKAATGVTYALLAGALSGLGGALTAFARPRERLPAHVPGRSSDHNPQKT
jgi:MFS family permease